MAKSLTENVKYIEIIEEYSDNIIELIPMAQLPDLTLEPQEPFTFPLGHDASGVVDTTPYNRYEFSIEDENGVPFIVSRRAKEVIGNGKAKMVVNGLTIVENERIGPIDKGEGFLALIRVKIANTSNEVMTIEKILVNGGAKVDFKPEELAVMGDKALPSTINLTPL